MSVLLAPFYIVRYRQIHINMVKPNYIFKNQIILMIKQITN